MKIRVGCVLFALAGAAFLTHPRPLSADPAMGDDESPVFGVPTNTSHRPARRSAQPRPAPSPAARPVPARPQRSSVKPESLPADPAVTDPVGSDPSLQDSPVQPDVPPGSVRDDAAWMLSTRVVMAHNPPPVGWNRLDVLVTDPATGRPVEGLLLHAAVLARGQRSPDAQPFVTEAGGGHYVVGRAISAIEPRGKHLLIVLRPPGPSVDSTLPQTDEPGSPEPSVVRTPPALHLDLQVGDLVLHTHLRMTGSWHIYRPGETWRKPARQSRVTIYTSDFVAPCFNAPIVELLGARETARHPDLVALGPDAITPEFDAAEARARIRRRPELEVSVALMDQKAMAGVGNVFKSEILFIRRVSPFRRVKDLTDETLDGLIEESHRLLRLNTERGNRRTMFHLDNQALLWVYGRSGHPCRVCGETIRMQKQGFEARSTYYCPACQR
ncbi:MAG: hypothetical protein LC772_05860 [Chloroflexi bacterium]|nr:hypothetical protein [Chloroflexota bacterium]